MPRATRKNKTLANKLQKQRLEPWMPKSFKSVINAATKCDTNCKCQSESPTTATMMLVSGLQTLICKHDYYCIDQCCAGKNVTAPPQTCIKSCKFWSGLITLISNPLLATKTQQPATKSRRTWGNMTTKNTQTRQNALMTLPLIYQMKILEVRIENTPMVWPIEAQPASFLFPHDRRSRFIRSRKTQWQMHFTLSHWQWIGCRNFGCLCFHYATILVLF